jgi:zinc/manganese transport system permease protein
MLAALAGEPRLTWNVVDDIRQLFDFPFMVHALQAGTIVAVTAGVIGWFMVLRRQTFAGHTLSLIGFPGGAGAVYLGLSAQLGFFAFCITGALIIAVLPRGGAGFSDESAVIGTVQAFALASGFLFVSLYGGNLNGINALLFGSIIGVTDADVIRVLVAGALTLTVIGVIGRPLLFASVDPDVAAARGVPVRGLAIAYTVLLGIAVAAATQVTGALLVFALLVLPAATAQTLIARPALGLVASVTTAVVVAWFGMGIAYYSPYPIGFWLSTTAFAIFVAARITNGVRRRAWRYA